MPRFRRRLGLRRRRVGARRTVRRARGRYRLKSRRTGTVRRLQRSVRRLYRINEQRSLRTEWYQNNFWRENEFTYNNNFGFTYLSFPVPSAALPMFDDSTTDQTRIKTRLIEGTFTGNTLTPSSLVVRCNFSATALAHIGETGTDWPMIVGITTPNGPSQTAVPQYPFPFSVSLRVLVVQLKGCASSIENATPFDQNYHPIIAAGVGVSPNIYVDGRYISRTVIGTSASYVKFRLLGTPWYEQNQPSARVNEINSPLRRGITRYLTVLADKRFTLSSGHRTSINYRIRCRRPADYVYPELPTSGYEIGAPEAVTVGDFPTNPVVVFWYYSMDDQTFNLVQSRRLDVSASAAFTTEMRYRDA